MVRSQAIVAVPGRSTAAAGALFKRPVPPARAHTIFPNAAADTRPATTIVSFATISTARRVFDVAAGNSDVSQPSIVQSPQLGNRQAAVSPAADSRSKSRKKRRDKRAPTSGTAARRLRSLKVFGLNDSC